MIEMAAGAAAGVLEHCVMYPVDVVRTRMQSVKPKVPHQSFVKTFKQTIVYEKFKTLRGMPIVIAGAGPAHALYFTLYEFSKASLLSLDPNASNSYRAMSHGLAGCAATLVHDAVMSPVDVIKQRMQMSDSPFRNSMQCARHIARTEGFRAFYRSYFTQLTMNLPYQALHFVTYELMLDLMNRNREYNPIAHMVSGGVAGAVGSAITTPLDVCKTLLNTQEKLVLAASNTERITGLANAARIVYKCSGIRGFFRGSIPRVLGAAPSTAISWSCYEFLKNIYHKEEKHSTLYN